MPKQKELSGKEVIDFFQSQGFFIVSSRGSHAKLRRLVFEARQTLVVPNHKFLSKGTTKEIYNQASRYIEQTVLRSFFYTEN